MKIAIIGSGYVGLVTGACFSHIGHEVICVDYNKQKLEVLKKGKCPIYEPGLEQIIQESMKQGRLSFSSNIALAVRESEVIFICVNTPPREDGGADLSYVENCSREIARNLKEYRLIVEKSTVPVETGEWVYKTIRANHKKRANFDVASNPEFLREGSAVEDFLKPDRIVIGVSNKKSEKILRKLYEPLKAPMVVTDIKSAELIKHASNSFLATKISFINMVSRVCDAVGADIEMVARGMGMDPRIGSSFLKAGIGFGGSCFPKDLAAFVHISEKLGIPFHMLRDVLEINEAQKKYFVQKIENELWNLKGKTIAVLGLAFKADTDDMRCAPSIDIIQALQAEGVKIRVYDPQGMPNARKMLPKITYAKQPYDAVKGADALLLLTEWKEFGSLDFKKIKKLLKHPVVFDGRNMLNPSELKRLGFDYFAMGRKV